MKITPVYPKRIFNQPYFKGVWTGVLIGGGFMFMISIDRLLGFVILLFSIVLYIYQASNDYNFIG